MTKPTPRPTLLEPAFRRFESHLAQACTGSFSLDPVTMMPPLKPSSYVSQARDAKRAFQMFKYRSALIPKDYPLARISLCARDGLVIWANPYEDRERERREEGQSVIIRGGKVVQVRQREQPKRTITITDWTGRTHLRAITDGILNPFDTLVLIHPKAQVNGFEQSVWTNLTFEPLNEGWWRVV